MQTSPAPSSILSPLEWLGCLVLALAAAAWFHDATIFPLDRLTRYDNDPAQMVWNLWIARHELLAGRSPFWTDLVFFPVGANLAHHTLAAGYLPVTLLAAAIGGEDVATFIVTYNVILWLSLTATFVVMYVAARDLGAPRVPAAGVAVAVGMSSFFKANFQHLNHVSAFFVPLVFWLGIRLYRGGGRATLYALALAGGLAFYFTETIVYAVMVGAIALPLWLLWRSGRVEILERLRAVGVGHFVAASLLAVVVSLPFFAAFFGESPPTYGLAEHARYSANLGAYFIPTIQMSPNYFPLLKPWADRITLGVDGTWVFLGYSLPAAALFGLSQLPRRERFVSILLMGLFLVLALGPFLKVFGTEWSFRMPYAWLIEFPTFRGSRTPARLVLPVLVLLGFVAAAGWAKGYARFPSRRGRFALSVAAVLWLGWVCFEVKSRAVPKSAWTPPVELGRTEPGTVLDLPFHMTHGYVGLAQIVHQQPTVSGAVVRLSQRMNDAWWPVNRAIDAGGAQMQAMLEERNVRTVVLPPTIPFDERSERHLQRSLEMHGVLRVDSRPPPQFFAGTPDTPATPEQFARSPLIVRADSPLVLTRDTSIRAKEIELTLEPDTAWQCAFFLQDALVGIVDFEVNPQPGSPMALRRLALTGSVAANPFDRVVLSLTKGSVSRVGHLHLR